MSDERERGLDILGLKPGASAQEIKAAYRDLAKVWHPDRFAHDPRLQEKAQDKLKEINEAYAALTSHTFNRSARPPRASTESTASHAPQPRSQETRGKYRWAVMALIVCAVTAGLFISPRLLKRGDNETGQMSTTSPLARAEVSEKNEALSNRSDVSSNRQDKKSGEKQKAPAEAASDNPVESHTPARAIPTVTVTIDPTTGQLATPACPSKTSMTYVAGQEPHQYCTADHRSTAKTQPNSEKKSRLKSLAKGLSTSARWLKQKTEEPDDEH